MWKIRPHLLIVMLACALPVSPQAVTYRIAGKVVRSKSNTPVRHARVSITMVENQDRGSSCVTGEAGEFSFAGLPPGKYALQVNDHGRWQRLNELDEYSTAIAVGPGRDSEHIIFPLAPLTSISGTVVDEAGDPVSGGMMYLFGHSITRGRNQYGLKNQGGLGPDGAFHFTHLTPGTYYVAVVARPWYSQSGYVQTDTPAEEQGAPRSELDVTYPVTYYSSSTSFEGATPVTVEEGARAEIQIAVHPVPALHIKVDGIEKPPDQQIMPSLSQLGPGGALITIPTMITPAGLTGVAPGDYVISANLPGSNDGAVEVQNVSLNGDATIHLTDAVTTSVTGKVVSDGAAPNDFMILFLNIDNGNAMPGLIAKDGSFSAQPLPGRYELLLANTPDLYIRTLAVKGGNYSNGQLDIAKGARIELTITVARGLSKVDGVVMNGDKSVAGAMVLLIPQDLSHGAFIPRDQSDSDGTFTANFAAPGRYTLVAIDNGRDLEYANPAAIAPYLRAGRVLDLPLPANTNVAIQVQARK